MSDYIGIDYGSIAGSNRDAKTGIHYGVISQHSVGQAWYDDAEPDYGEPTCPKCGSKVANVAEIAADTDEWPRYHRGCDDYACESCEHTLDSQDVFPDEANGYSYEGNGYILTDCLDSDIFVLKSPYYTFAAFCSPCVPGAGDLDSPRDSGVKCYLRAANRGPFAFLVLPQLRALRQLGCVVSRTECRAPIVEGIGGRSSNVGLQLILRDILEPLTGPYASPMGKWPRLKQQHC